MWFLQLLPPPQLLFGAPNTLSARTAAAHARGGARPEKNNKQKKQSLHEAWVPKYFQYTGFNLLLAFSSTMALFLISPAASGSGIPDVKAYLNGEGVCCCCGCCGCVLAGVVVALACEGGGHAPRPATQNKRQHPTRSQLKTPKHPPKHPQKNQKNTGVESPIFRNFFTVKTFVAKVIGSALAVASSLVMGKEGPMLHAGSILAVILGLS